MKFDLSEMIINIRIAPTEVVGLTGALYTGENELDEADRRRPASPDSIKFCFCFSRSPANGSQSHVLLNLQHAVMKNGREPKKNRFEKMPTSIKTIEI